MMALAPPPPPDPSQIETRLLVVAEMLDRAVAEVQRALDAVKNDMAPPPPASDAEQGSGDSRRRNNG